MENAGRWYFNAANYVSTFTTTSSKWWYIQYIPYSVRDEDFIMR